MDSENESQQEQEVEPNKADKAPSSHFGFAMKEIENTELVSGSVRQIINGGLLGTCLVFVIAMLGLSAKQIDAPLSLSIRLFAIAIPTLVLGFMMSSYKLKPAKSSPYIKALINSSRVIEAVGAALVTFGVFAVIAHLSSLAYMLWSVGVTIVAAFVLMMVFLIIEYWPDIKKEQQRRKSGKQNSKT